ncbi:MAG TPA: pyruvate kinase [Candidatus Coproplasma excrementigallinarum]|mgnify:FL=1|uniref:Pyruvate kinase n=1 Tax=Candidatus Coproplasma excrementigallinarum TaxID=2840747 RepID=A0A9D1MKW9_9FIRM|nr:pyruvate kinase [Candidatus Coproplasma excrementigallinarum]
MKKTKIICTLGPASDTEEIISDLIDAGMNVARINFSHGTYEEQADKIEKIKKVRERKKLPIAIMLDTKGPEFRIGTFKDGKIFLNEGDPFTFTTEKIEGDQTRVSVSFDGICEQLKPGDKILLNDGLMLFEVVKVKKPDVFCKTIEGGELSNRKSMFFPDKELKMTYLSEQDKQDIAFGLKLGIDYIACSFVSRAQDVIDIRNWLKECGSPEGEVEIIAKIESRAGVNNIDEILEASDGIMVARGDLGVEIPFEEVPNIQKTIIHKCRIQGKRSITATEMLESMIKNPRPTRAEISDVANAVYDGSSAIMLSGETAAGEHPVEAVKAMAKIAEQAEKNTQYINYIKPEDYHIKNLSEALSHSACTLAQDIGAKLIVACTRSGYTAKLVSRFRPMIDIIGMTTDERAYRKLALSWGVIPVMSEEFSSVDVLFHFGKCAAIATGLVKKGDKIVLTGGKPNGKSGNANLISVETI